MPDVMTHDGKPIDRYEAYGTLEVRYGTMQGVQKAGSLNATAAIWTAGSVVFSALSSIAGSLG
jgi:hypothetical protein